MRLELRFDGLAEDLLDARVDVQIQDLGVADAPPRPATAASRVSVSPDRPSVAISVDLPVGGYDPGLLVRVRGRTVDDRPIEFFNTGATPVRGGPAGTVRVELARIR